LYGTSTSFGELSAQSVLVFSWGKGMTSLFELPPIAFLSIYLSNWLPTWPPFFTSGIMLLPRKSRREIQSWLWRILIHFVVWWRWLIVS